MFKSLKSKLIIIFTIIILLSIGFIDYVVLSKYLEEKLEDRRSRNFAFANIIADLSSDQLNNIIGLRMVLYQYAHNIDGRVLILDSNAQVIADSFHNLEEQTFLSNEVTEALNNRNGIGLYDSPSKIMQLAVPIVSPDQQEHILGAVLLSISIEDIDASLHQLRWQVIIISLIATLCAIGMGVLAAIRLSKPITTLTSTAKKISMGHLGAQVHISGKDEIARFAKTFNEMSREIAHIDENRRNFISSASHELKTPLASMKALIQPLLEDNVDMDTYREFLQDIDGEIDRLTGLIHSLLTLAKMEEWRIKPVQQNLYPLVHRVITMLQPIAKENKVSLVNKLPHHLELFLDEEQITSLFVNLIENGIKYRHPKKDSYVSISLEEDSQYYRIIVADNGIGMDQKTIDSLHKPFYRADHSRARSTGGYGLGLSIVHKIIQLHGWDIQIKSEIDIGSSFIINIPKKNITT